MSLQATDLIAVWEGVSTSRMNDPTEWTDTCLVFLPSSSSSSSSASSNVQVFDIKGRGISVWRNERIDFTVSGSLNVTNMTFSMTKSHMGKYTNLIKFHGFLSFEQAEAETGGETDGETDGEDGGSGRRMLRLSGEYPNGAINLFQKSGGVNTLLETMLSSKLWQGSSVSRANDQTCWGDVDLKFTSLQSSSEQPLSRISPLYEITGLGISHWRNLRINFILRGTLNILTSKVFLIKEHHGEYNNTVRYSGYLDYSGESEGGGKLVINGVYSNGRIVLMCGDDGENDESGVGVDSVVFKVGLEGFKELYADCGDDGEEEDGDEVNDEEMYRYEYEREELFEDDDDNDSSFGSDEDENEEDDHEIQGANQQSSPSRHNSTKQKICQPSASTSASTSASISSSKDLDHLDRDICKICFTNEINTVLIPCGHFSNCLDCGKRLTLCPICREVISHVQEIYRA